MVMFNFIPELKEFAIKHLGFEVQFEKPEFNLVRFVRDDIRVDVWLSGTVGIYKNKEQKHIRNQSFADTKEILVNL